MIIRLLPFALLVAALPVAATTVACPDLAAAAQVASCPAEEELRYTFTGYCSDDGKAYKGSKEETDAMSPATGRRRRSRPPKPRRSASPGRAR